MNTYEINGHTLEYLDESHTYLVDGVIVPSITQALKVKFGKKYEGIDKEVLKRASDKGTAVHEAIERWCKTGEQNEDDPVEVRNFIFLKNTYKFNVLENEVPVILSKDGEPILAGRLDLVIEMTKKNDNGNSQTVQTGLADIKRTSVLDKDYLAYQLNLYRIAYQQSYGKEIQFLRGIHLREDARKFVMLPVKEKMAWELVDEFMEEQNGNF